MDDLQELTNALSNATLHSLPFPKIGGSQPPLKTAIWLSDKLLGNFIIMEKTEAGLRGLCIREIDVKSQILVTYR